ncbi:MAG: hypothetical protein WAO61_03815 [Solirubrobacterales bacterium]
MKWEVSENDLVALTTLGDDVVSGSVSLDDFWKRVPPNYEAHGILRAIVEDMEDIVTHMPGSRRGSEIDMEFWRRTDGYWRARVNAAALGQLLNVEDSDRVAEARATAIQSFDSSSTTSPESFFG